MLMNEPEKFKTVAQEWAVKYAGAPKSNLPTTASSDSVRPGAPKSKEEEAREQLAK